MSSLTSCNYCTLRALRKKYKGTGTRVLVRNNAKWGMGGVNVYALLRGVLVPDGGIEEDSEFHKKWFKCWLMEISDHCVC